MRYNTKLIERCARGVPGEQTMLLGIPEIAKEEGYTVYKAQTEHPMGMPISAYRDENGELNVLQRNGLCHALVAGATGCGKSLRYSLNYLFNLDGKSSAIICDIKGELFRYAAEYLKAIYGEDNVKFMDFIRPDTSQILFNPITDIARRYLEAELYPDRKTEMRNEALADLKILFDKLFPIRSQKDLSWDEGARGFIYGITLGLFEDMLLNKEQELKTGRRRVLPEQINFEAISEVFYRFDYNRGFDDYGFFSSRPDNDPVWRYVRGIINDAPNTRACYIQLVESYLNGYSYPDIRNLTITDNLDISTLAEAPQVIFLTYDITDIRMRDFVNQYIVKSLDTFKKKAIDMGAPLKVPVMYLLDEFPTLQADPIYPTIFSVGRGWNIYITAIVQDFTQLETTYSGGVAQQIRNNCNLTFFLGTNDAHTAQAVKKQIGKHIVPDPATLLQGEIRFIEEYVVSEDELMRRIKPGDAYITVNSHMPLKGFFELYFSCPEYTRFPLSFNKRQRNSCLDDSRYHYDASWISPRSNSRRKNLWE